jgi:hypothetical protein
MSIDRQRFGRQVSAATDTQATIRELLEKMFSIRSVQSNYKEGGGGVEYLHRDPASRRRRRKGKSQI